MTNIMTKTSNNTSSNTSGNEGDFSFVPLYYADKLHIVNKGGYIGITPLWSQLDWVLNCIEKESADLLSETSPVAVLGNLYGNGLPEMLRALRYNPQICHIVVCGKDRSHSKDELMNFFKKGLEDVEFLGEKHSRIIGTQRIMDGMITPQDFPYPIQIHWAGDLKTQESKKNLISLLKQLKPLSEEIPQRVNIPLPTVKVKTFPSHSGGHVITAQDPVKAWVELIFRLVRFGVKSTLKKGDRLELQNVKVIVDNPVFPEKEALIKNGFSPDSFKEYYDTFLQKELPPDYSYTYGSRIGSYFEKNTLDDCIENLKKDPESRQSFISLWDSSRDISSPTGHPCLVSLFFRKFQNRLTLSGVFRTHNSLNAWLMNYCGLLKVLREVSEKTGIPAGSITVISHSISIDPRKLDFAKSVAAQRTYEVCRDPNGEFIIEVRSGEILVRHMSCGIEIDRYQSANPVLIQNQLYKNRAVSDINHAIYIGRMLERAARCIRTGEVFVQE